MTLALERGRSALGGTASGGIREPYPSPATCAASGALGERTSRNPRGTHRGGDPAQVRAATLQVIAMTGRHQRPPPRLPVLHVEPRCKCRTGSPVRALGRPRHDGVPEHAAPGAPASPPSGSARGALVQVQSRKPGSGAWTASPRWGSRTRGPRVPGSAGSSCTVAIRSERAGARESSGNAPSTRRHRLPGARRGPDLITGPSNAEACPDP